MITLRKTYTSEAGFSGMKKVKNPLKFFLNLEKFNETQSQIRKIIANNKEITDPNKIQNEIRIFTNLFLKKVTQSLPQKSTILLLRLNIIEIHECDNELSEKALYMSLMSMQNNKSPGNNGLTKEFFVTFWYDIEDALINSRCIAKLEKELSPTQRQAIVKLMEKKDKDRKDLLKIGDQFLNCM